MSNKYGINGMGVLGRRLLLTADLMNDVVLINDPNVTLDNLIYLLKHDSVYGQTYTMTGIIESIRGVTDSSGGEYLVINGYQIRVTHFSDTALVPCGECNVNIMIDCMKLSNETFIKNFLNAGASKVLLPYVYTSSYPTVSWGVNHTNLTSSDTIASCGTAEMNIIGLLLSRLGKSIHVSSALGTVLSPYTNGQGMQDSSTVVSGSLQQGRAGAWNLTPAACADIRKIGFLVPEINGKVIGDICYTPVIAGGVIKSIISTSDTSITVSGVNSMLKAISEENDTLLKYTEEPLVSSDIISTQIISKNGNIGATFLGGMTAVLEDTQTGGCLISIEMLYDPIAQQVANVSKVLSYWGNL